MKMFPKAFIVPYSVSKLVLKLSYKGNLIDFRLITQYVWKVWNIRVCFK